MAKKTDLKLELRSSQRVVDERNRIVIAEGRMALLEAIVATGSINQAAKSMGMAYKSAWSKIRSTEAHLKRKIVHSDTSKGTRLTQAGQELLNKYQMLKQQCRAADDAVFDTVFNADAGETASVKKPQGPYPPIVSFVGHSGSGKTTLIEKLIPLLANAGIKVAVIKHDVHGFEMDKPGKDTWRHKKAGAVATVISSATQIGLVMDADHDHSPEELVPYLSFADLIIAEGYKRWANPKIEVFRPAATGDADLICRNDPDLIAVISDTRVTAAVPCFNIADLTAVVDFLRSHLAAI